MVSAAVRPLVRPAHYFRERSPGLPVKPALLAAAVAGLASLLASAIAMWAILAQIPPDATFVVDGEAVAARAAAEEAARQQLGYAIPGAFFGWVVLVLVVHFGSLLDADVGDLTDSTAVASWGFVALSVEGVLRGLLLAALVRMNGPAGTLDALKRQVEGAVAGLSAVGFLLQLAAVVWMGYVVFAGLRHARGMDRDGAVLVGSCLALFVLVLGAV